MTFFDLCELGVRASVLFGIDCSIINTEYPKLKANILNRSYGFDIHTSYTRSCDAIFRDSGTISFSVSKQSVMCRDVSSDEFGIKDVILQVHRKINDLDSSQYTLALSPGYITKIKKVLKETQKGMKTLQSLSLRNESNKLEKWFDFIMPILWGYSDCEISFYNNLDSGRHIVATVSCNGIIFQPYRNNTCVGIFLIHRNDSYSASREALRRLVIELLDRLECDDDFTVSVTYKNEPFDLSVVYKDMLETVHNLDDYSSWQSLGNGEKYKRIL